MNEPPPLIFLIGPRGTGKTTVGRLLAERLGWQFVDADPLLEERAGKSIREIFANHGESGFRELESKLLEELCGLHEHVIATGGGVIVSERNRELLRHSGCVIWLHADAQTLWERISRDPTSNARRPNLAMGGVEEVREILRRREALYRECARHRIDTTAATPTEIVQSILAGLPRFPKP